MLAAHGSDSGGDNGSGKQTGSVPANAAVPARYVPAGKFCNNFGTCHCAYINWCVLGMAAFLGVEKVQFLGRGAQHGGE